MVHSYMPGGAIVQPTQVHNQIDISIGSAIFAQLTAKCRHTLQRADADPLTIANLHRGSRPPTNTWFFEPTRVHNPNGILIGSAVSAWLMTMTDRQTDDAIPVTIGLQLCM